MATSDLQQRLRRRLKLQQLRVLAAVAKQGSFRKAAQTLHLSQPALTKAIADLEQTLGVLLFDRSAQGVTPTVHGESFIRRAEAILGEVCLAAQEIEIISGGSRGTLRVGIGGGGWGMGILPAALTKLLEPQPDARVLTREADEGALVELLKAREIDLFVARLAPVGADPELAYQPLFEDSICVLASRTHPLAARKRVSWDDLAAERWVVPPPSALSFDHVQRTLHKGGLTMPRHAVQTMAASVALGMVLQGSFLCFGTYLFHELSVLRPLLTILKVELPQVPVAFGAVTLKDRDPNPLGTRLAATIAELADAARNGSGAGAVQAAGAARRR